jgi:hypothetical protein
MIPTARGKGCLRGAWCISKSRNPDIGAGSPIVCQKRLHPCLNGGSKISTEIVTAKYFVSCPIKYMHWVDTANIGRLKYRLNPTLKAEHQPPTVYKYHQFSSIPPARAVLIKKRETVKDRIRDGDERDRGFSRAWSG